MLTRLGYYADRFLEFGWLAAVVFVPLFFNVYSSRVFEPDKISTLRSLVLLMTVAWLIKMLEGGVRAYSQASAPTRAGRLSTAMQGAAESGLPSWLGFLRVPMIVPILVYALTYIISSIFTVTPDATIYGSYQRLQGTYSQFSYMMLGILVIANLRTRVQLDRLINFMILTSVPVVLYGLLQWARLDPLPWAGDTSTRVASSMGNAIFVAAWVIMIVPLTLYKLFNNISARRAARETEPEPEETAVRGRASRKVRPLEAPSYGWAVVANGLGIILIQLFVFFFALKLVAGLPFPDSRMWPTIPLALAIFFAGCWALEWLGNHRDEPVLVSPLLTIVGILIFLTSFLSICLSWSIQRIGESNDYAFQTSFDGGGILWVLFFTLLWGAMSALAFALTEREVGEANPNLGIVPLAVIIGYGSLIFLQLLCIYLTQSRGPWLGLGAGLVVFAVALWLAGRRRNVRWMARIGGIVSAIILLLALFVGALNIPESPLKALNSLPVIGRGIDRLSTLTRTEEGTGKVRTLIWQGATNLILSDPLRSVIGWGPEAMYVAYNPFYPPELAQVELRNATPDRSHNVEFDQLVTMGVMGLLAYYFLVGAFFFYGIRLLKRATNIRDQLLAIALLAAMASHFVEIQTGIQIAATWTYFYLLIGMMVAFGYYMTTYLRKDVAVAAADAASLMMATDGEDATQDAVMASPVSAGRGAVAAGAMAQRQTAVTASVGGNSKGASGQSSTPKVRERGTHPAAAGNVSRGKQTSTPQTQGQGQGRNGGQSSEARRRQAAAQAQASRNQAAGSWVNNPVMLVVYGLIAFVALLIIWTVNVATVRADTLYKQGLAYDSARLWAESINLYQDAVNMQPNQDYYYLFLGRAWLEFAKQVATEENNTRYLYQNSNQATYRTNLYLPCQGPQTYSTDQVQQAAEKKAEMICRLQKSESLLKHANELSPLNTDHYANLGRLYLYWADPSGPQDPSKNQLAVDNFIKATQHTPGNAQLWDELGVAYARNGQFDKAMEAINHSQQNVDPTYARTPFIKGQLLQERAANVKNALIAGVPLPTDYETDYGRLVIETGRAYSETIGIDPTQFTDSSFKGRIAFLLDAGRPFTGTNTTVDQATLSNVLTSTVMLAYELKAIGLENHLTGYLRSIGAYNGTENMVPGEAMAALRQNPQWAAVKTEGGAPEWLDPNIRTITHNTAINYYGLGYIYSVLGRRDPAIAAYQRALVLEPTNTEIQQDLQTVQNANP
ncbi:MAG TPA: O-antigen ligase family protein [Chloroflexia bacterium]|nr:O-antigen ligase family protein [Chloroflexia bacterium]